MAADWTLLWDEDCGFCAATLSGVIALDRGRRVRTVAIQSEEGQRLLAGIPVEERLKSAHLVDPSGRVLSGGTATATYLRLIPGGGPLAALVDRVPSVPERGYRWVAEHRRQLSKPIPMSWKDAARGRIKRRAEQLASAG